MWVRGLCEDCNNLAGNNTYDLAHADFAAKVAWLSIPASWNCRSSLARLRLPISRPAGRHVGINQRLRVIFPEPAHDLLHDVAQ